MKDFIQVKGEDFAVNGSKITMRGFGIGSWMNLEHFMIGMPGSEHLIKQTFREVLGAKQSENFLHNFLTDFITEKDFIYLKSLGVNAIRVPVNYHYFLNDQKPDGFLDDGFRYLDNIVSLCEKYRIYMVIDMHAVPGGQNPDWHSDNGTGISMFWLYRCFRDQVVRLWAHIAEHYKNNPWVGAYDLLNEPFFIEDKSLLNEFYSAAIEAIRQVDKKHVIFLEGDHFAMDFSMLDEPQDANVAYEFHYYPTVWNPDVMDREMPENQRKQIFTESFQQMVAIRRKFHRPIWCGEFGCAFDNKNINFIHDMIKYTIDLCEMNDVSWTLWAYKDSRMMGIVYPADTTPWIEFTGKIRAQWDQARESQAAQSVIHFMEQKWFKPISPELAYKSQFRLRAIFQTVYCEQILKPAISSLSAQALEKLPESFLWENCKRIEKMEELICSYTK